MTKSKKENNSHLLTLRVPPSWVKRYEEIRNSRSEKRSVSQIIRDEMEMNHQVSMMDPRRRAGKLIALQKEREKTLLRLRDHILNDADLVREEWEFLCLEAASAYSKGRRGPFDSALLSDVVKAFRDFIRYRNQVVNFDSSENSYYISNLIQPKHLDQKCTLEEAIEHTLSIIEKEAITSVGGSYMVRNLEVCLRDEERPLPDKGINESFKPYGKSLLSLAAYSYYFGSEYSTGLKQPYTQALEYDWTKKNWSKIYEQDGLRLHVQRLHDSVTALLTVEADWFSQMQGFTFHSLEDFFIAVTYDKEVGKYQGIDNSHQGEKYCFVHFDHGGNRWCIEKTHYDRLKSLISDVMSDSEYNEIRAEARLVYGAI